MTEVLFYHLQNMPLEKRAAAAAREIARARLAGGGAVDLAGARRGARCASVDLSATIRSCRTRTWRAGDAPDQPIILAIEEDNPNGANVRFLIDNAALPADCDSYERLVLVFNGEDDDALAAAREAWTDCKARGFEVTYWQADERGRWQRRE